MKALVIHEPEVFAVEQDWPKPSVKKKGWISVRVLYAGVCGSDLPRFGAAGTYRYPSIPGHEFAGVVDEVGPGPTDIKRGDPVAVLPIIPCGECEGCMRGQPFHCSNYQFLGSRNDGGFAEYCLVPEKNLFPLPEGLDPRIGSLIEPLAVALHAVRRSNFAAGGSALVLGAGPIGMLVGVWLKEFGASRVVMADIRAENLAVARRMGFSETVNPRERGLRLNGPFDVSFEAAGSAVALRSAIENTRDMGSITLVGRDTGDMNIPLESVERFMRGELNLYGCWGYNMAGEGDLVRETLDKWKARFPVVITHEVPLDEAPSIIRRMIAREFHFCKVLLKI